MSSSFMASGCKSSSGPSESVFVSKSVALPSMANANPIDDMNINAVIRIRYLLGLIVPPPKIEKGEF